MKITQDRYLIILFFLGVVICLIPIWSNYYFVTGDGPSHLYNSTILNTLFEENQGFTANYYEINKEFEPNWLSHSLYSILVRIFPGFIAEKILLTSYITLFFLGLKSLLKTINPSSTWLVLVSIPLVYQKIFLMGFFNCAFGFVVFFYTLDFWLRNKSNLTWKNVAFLTILLLLNFFTHPISLALSLSTIGLSFLGSTFQEQDLVKEWKRILARILKLTLAILPSLLLIISYVLRSNQASIPLSLSNKQLYHSLIEADFLFNLSLNEHLPAMLFSIFLGIVLLHALVKLFVVKDWALKGGFGVLLLLLIGLYFNLPDYMAGGAFFVERLQFVIFLIAILWIANFSFSPFLNKTYASVLFLLGSIIVVNRYSTHHEMSKAAFEIVSSTDFVEDNSTLLTLSYNHNGLGLSGELICNHFWSFMHIGDYVCAEKNLVSLTNYEANTGYFPINYKDEVNPYGQLGFFEGQPPNPTIKEYNENTPGNIDYVLLVFYEKKYDSLPEVKNTFADLNESYDKIYTSENSRAILYKQRANN